MAGLLVNATDLDSTYGFKITSDGVTLGAAPARRITIPIPGIEGELYQGLELGPRPILIRGVIVGTNQADMYTKLIGMEGVLVVASGSFGTAPASFVSPTRAEFTLTIPTFGGKKFPNCSYDGMDIEYVGPRILTRVCFVTIKFVQSRPFTVAA